VTREGSDEASASWRRRGVCRRVARPSAPGQRPVKGMLLRRARTVIKKRHCRVGKVIKKKANAGSELSSVSGRRLAPVYGSAAASTSS
jgi:hypothetical protein